MADIAKLSFSIDSRDVVDATQDLNTMTAAAGRAENAQESLARTAGQTAVAHTRISGAVAGITPLMAQTARGTRQLANDNRNLVYQLNDVAVSLASGMPAYMVALQQGSQISQLYAGQGGVAMAFKQTGLMAQSATTGILRMAAAHPVAALAVAGLSLGLHGIVSDLQEAGHAGIGYGDVMVAAMQVAASGIYSYLKPAVDFIGPYITSAFDAVTAFMKEWGNRLIRLVVGSFEIIKAAVMAIPAAFAAAGGMAANGFLAAIEYMAREALVMINGTIAKINGMLPEGMKMGFAPAPASVSFERFDTSGAIASLQKQYADLDAVAGKIARTDYLSKFADAVKTKAIANNLTDVQEAATGAGNALKKAATDAKDPWEKLRNVTPGVAEDMEAIKQRMETVANAGKQLGSDLGGVFKGLIDGTMDWKDAALSAFKAILQYANQMNVAGGGKGLFGGGFFQSLIGGLLGVSFDGGGYTGNGPRSGGIDGKGGFPAILHPRETVIDHTRTRNSPANNNGGNTSVTISLSEGLRGEIIGEANAGAVKIVQSGISQYDTTLNRTLPARMGKAQARAG